MTKAEPLSCNKRMKLIAHLSLKSLILLGFAIAVIPVYVAELYAAHTLHTSSAVGRSINIQILEQTKTLGLVLQKASDIERKARLFVLLSDPAIRHPYERESYESARTAFKQALTALLKLNIDNKTTLLINELSEKESLIYQEIINSESSNNFKLPIEDAFLGLRESSNSLSKAFETNVEQTFDTQTQSAEALEKSLWLQGSILLLIGFTVILLLLTILSRSFARLDHAIRRLSSNQLQSPIELSGTRDLHVWAEHLEWLRSQLLWLQLSKQQLLKNLANEIDNALNPVENAERMPETNRQQTIKTSLNKLKIIQQQLTQYHQALIAAPQHQREYLDAEQILETVITEAQSALEAKSITMQKTTEPLKIHAVYQHIHDIFEQLLHNATRYSPEAGEIRVTLSHVKDWLQLEVEDDGIGLSAEDRNLTFAPFYRHATNQNEAFENQPELGLTLIREYVAQHQGKIDYLAPKPGYLGAHIRVQLPLSM